MSDVDAPKNAARPRIADVARAAGVSITTVSHALSNSGRVNEQTRTRVLDAAAKLGYRPSPRATALRHGRSRTIAIASSMHTAVAGGASRQGFYLELAAAAAERAFEHGYALVLVPPVASEAAEQLSRLSVDGLLVVEPSADDPVIQLARCARLPFVSLGTYPDAIAGERQVQLPTEQVAELVVQHLHAAQVKHPALIIGEQQRTSYRDVEEVYLRQGWQAIIKRVSESDGEEGGRLATKSLLDQHPDVDAVIAWVDAFAVGALHAAKDAGRDVPEDLRVVTRYDGPRARGSQPQLTAVNLHLGEAARTGVDMLLGAIGAVDEPGSPASAMPAPELVCRASSPPVD